jgi:hypothetical protein
VVYKPLWLTLELCFYIRDMQDFVKSEHVSAHTRMKQTLDIIVS